MPNELKSCPFCRGEVSIARMSENDDVWWLITRGNGENRCTCRVFMESAIFTDEDPHALKFAIRDDLIDAWNRRADNG